MTILLAMQSTSTGYLSKVRVEKDDYKSETGKYYIYLNNQLVGEATSAVNSFEIASRLLGESVQLLFSILRHDTLEYHELRMELAKEVQHFLAQ